MKLIIEQTNNGKNYLIVYFLIRMEIGGIEQQWGCSSATLVQ